MIVMTPYIYAACDQYEAHAYHPVVRNLACATDHGSLPIPRELYHEAHVTYTTLEHAPGIGHENVLNNGVEHYDIRPLYICFRPFLSN